MRIEGGKASGVAKAASKETPQSAPAASVAAVKESVRPTPAVAPVQVAPAILPEAPVDVPAAPSVRRFAREIGINIGQVPGTGPGGRISIEDVKAFAKALNTSRATMAPTGVAAKPLPDFSKWGTIDRQPMNNIRKRTAEHMTLCWTTIPHVTQFDKADITDLEQSRKKFSKPGRKLTVTPFLLKVIATALKTFPEFNASIDMAAQEIIYKNIATSASPLIPTAGLSCRSSVTSTARPSTSWRMNSIQPPNASGTRKSLWMNCRADP